MDIPKYRNAPHAAYTIIKEEGIRALYKGVALTALRQGMDRIHAWDKSDFSHYPVINVATNQAANFTAYQELKKWGKKLQDVEELPSYQTLVIGGISGAMGKFGNLRYSP